MGIETIVFLLAVLVLPAVVLGVVMRPSAVAKREHRKALSRWNLDLAAANAWSSLLQFTRDNSAQAVYVSSVYQRGQRGSKIVIAWREGGLGPEYGAALVRGPAGQMVFQDAWTWWHWPTPGSWIAVDGASGFGPHNNNPDTFFVGDVGGADGVLATAPLGAPEAWLRCASVNWHPPCPPGLSSGHPDA